MPLQQEARCRREILFPTLLLLEQATDHAKLILTIGITIDGQARAGYEWGTTGRLSGQFNPPLHFAFHLRLSASICGYLAFHLRISMTRRTSITCEWDTSRARKVNVPLPAFRWIVPNVNGSKSFT